MKKKSKVIWYKLKKAEKVYHFFHRSNRVYPFEPVTSCGRYIKTQPVKETARPDIKCKKCVSESESRKRCGFDI